MRRVAKASLALSLLCGCLLMAGCNQIAGNILRVAEVAISESLPVPLPTQAEVEALPYAQLWVRGFGRDGRLVLGYEDQGRLAWYTGEGAILFTRDGMVVGTHGFPGDNLLAMQVRGLPADWRQLQEGQTIQRHYDWMPGYRLGVPVTGTWSHKGLEPTALMADFTLPLLRLEEKLTGPGVKQKNIYWLDPASGAVRKTRQWIAPGKQVELTFLKPYQP